MLSHDDNVSYRKAASHIQYNKHETNTVVQQKSFKSTRKNKYIYNYLKNDTNPHTKKIHNNKDISYVTTSYVTATLAYKTRQPSTVQHSRKQTLLHYKSITTPLYPSSEYYASGVSHHSVKVAIYRYIQRYTTVTLTHPHSGFPPPQGQGWLIQCVSCSCRQVGQSVYVCLKCTATTAHHMTLVKCHPQQVGSNKCQGQLIGNS